MALLSSFMALSSGLLTWVRGAWQVLLLRGLRIFFRKNKHKCTEVSPWLMLISGQATIPIPFRAGVFSLSCQRRLASTLRGDRLYGPTVSSPQRPWSKQQFAAQLLRENQTPP